MPRNGHGTATMIKINANTKYLKAFLYFVASSTFFLAMPYPKVIIRIANIIEIGCSIWKKRKVGFFIIEVSAGIS